MKSGIAWSVDRTNRFQYSEDWINMPDEVTRQGYRQVKQGLYLPKINDEDYMVWARTAALPNFRKLHRIIKKLPSGEDTLKAGTVLNVTIANWFPVGDFNGEKHFVLTTLTWFGGSAMGLAITYLVVGSLAVLTGIMIFFRAPPRKLGDFAEFQDWGNLEN